MLQLHIRGQSQMCRSDRAQAGGMDSMWRVIEQVAHEFHTAAAGMEACSATKGKAQWEDELPNVNTGTGDAATLALRAVSKRKRQLQHLHSLTLRGEGCAEVARRALQDALERAGPPEFQGRLRRAAGNEALLLGAGAPDPGPGG